MGEKQMQRLLWTGLIGIGTVALCCVTPLLMALLGVIGLATITGYLDYVLLPVMAVCLGLAVYVVSRRCRASTHTCCQAHE
jgi:Membrane transport protein MerF